MLKLIFMYNLFIQRIVRVILPLTPRRRPDDLIDHSSICNKVNKRGVITPE